MDYSGTTATRLNKYQWDLIHDPNKVLFAWTEEEEEGASMNGGTLFLTIIQDYINQIRQGNKDKKSEISMKITTGLGEYDKITLGNNNYNYIKMVTTGFNLILDKESAERLSYSLNPSELSKTSYTVNNIKYTKYQFHELQTKQNKPPYADTKEPTGNTRVEISVKTIESISFEEYIYPLDDVFLENITWVSQFDESIFGLCSGCWSTSCCRRAAEYMMGNTNIANCSDTKIAENKNNAYNLQVNGVYNIAGFSDNSSTYSVATYNTTPLNYYHNEFINAVSYIKERLKNQKPVLIGTHYINENSTFVPKNSNRATRHFMIIVGMGMKDDKIYFRFYDPGREVVNQINATSRENIFTVDYLSNKIEAYYNNKTYTITEIIITN